VFSCRGNKGNKGDKMLNATYVYEVSHPVWAYFLSIVRKALGELAGDYLKDWLKWLIKEIKFMYKNGFIFSRTGLV
jgi:hypothetical protein